MPWERTPEGNLNYVKAEVTTSTDIKLTDFYEKKVQDTLEALCLTDSYSSNTNSITTSTNPEGIGSGPSDFNPNHGGLDSFTSVGAKDPTGFGINWKKTSRETYFKLRSLVQQEASKQSMDWRLIMALIEAESNFVNLDSGDQAQNGLANPNHYYKSIGYMQVQIQTAWDKKLLPRENSYVTERKLLDMATNIRCGVSELSGYLKKYGSINLALASYNGGPGNRTKPGPTAYANKIIKYYKDPKRQY